MVLVSLDNSFLITYFLFEDGGNFRLWWRSYNDNDNGVFRVVPNDTESIWEKTDNFVPAIPTAFEQVWTLPLFF